MQYPEDKQTTPSVVANLMFIFLILSFLILVPPLIKRIVHEKESGIKAIVYYSYQFMFLFQRYNIQDFLEFNIFKLTTDLYRNY